MLKYPKRFTKNQKTSILSEHLKEGLSISELSRKYQVYLGANTCSCIA